MLANGTRPRNHPLKQRQDIVHVGETVSSPDESPAPASAGGPTTSDILFLIALAGVMMVVVILGRITINEGLKTESTKVLGETLLAWIREVGPRRSEHAFEPAACALTAENFNPPLTWSDCAKALRTSGAPLADKSNSFTGKPIGLIGECNPHDTETVGQIAVHKISPTPPGSAVPNVVSPIADDEPINQHLLLRLHICDKGGYAILIGEAGF